ncbi:MAG: DUF3987 domain-containing protein [Verrucomicrobia bacterium]|nr:DUF3987 domain-containing protein [Verrucomicrobiota bacterium]
MAVVTLFKNFSTPVEDISLIILSNRLASDQYKTQVEEIRDLIAEGKSEEAQAKKQQLPAFTPSATFKEKRVLANMEQYSGFVHLDFDKLNPLQLAEASQVIAQIPYTFLCFTSPSGKGLKVFIEVNTGAEHHETAYRQVREYYEKATGLKADEKCKDITRLCFVSYDPQLYKNIGNKKFEITGIELPIAKATELHEPMQPVEFVVKDDYLFPFQQQITFTNQKAEYTNGNRNNYIYLLASNCNRAGIPELDTLVLCQQHFDLPEKEIKTAIHSAYTHHAAEFAQKPITAKYNEATMNSQKTIQEMPTLPDEIFPLLPDFLQRIVKVSASKEERDILLLGSIVVLSSCLPKLIGYYDDKKVNANLFLFITAQASAGKGRLIHCRQLVAPVHKAMREQAALLKREYDAQMADYNASKGKDANMEKPVKPPEKMLFIPANNSSTGFFQLLNDSGGRGLIFETEGDTMAQSFKSDYGNYSHGFRNAFQHEPISYYRRTDRELVEIERPCLSALLSGTPKQIGTLIPNAENGLFSRFMFYVMNIQPVWKDVFASNTDQGLDKYFADLSTEFYTLYQALNNNGEIIFTLTDSQKQEFNKFFAEMQTLYIGLKGLDYIGTVRRSGLIAFRMMMVCSVLRILETGDISSQIICENADFNNTNQIVKLLVKHAAKVYSDLPEEPVKPKPKNRKERFLEALPHRFNRQGYLSVAVQLNIPDKTAQGYITDFVKAGILDKEGQDLYINPNAQPPNPQNTNSQDAQEVQES